jgi:DNA primase large subunit
MQEEQLLKEDEIAEIVIDFEELRQNQLNESFLRIFGNVTKFLLRRMFGEDIFMPVKIRGRPSEIKAFAQALGREKRYIEAYKKHGLNDPRTHASKGMLSGAISKFTKATGLKWPFK